MWPLGAISPNSQALGSSLVNQPAEDAKMALPIQFYSSDQKLKAQARKPMTRLFSISKKTMSRPVTVHRHGTEEPRFLGRLCPTSLSKEKTSSPGDPSNEEAAFKCG